MDRNKEHFEPVTARALSEKAYNIATSQYVSNSSRGQAIRDMESLIEPHIRKSSGGLAPTPTCDKLLNMLAQCRTVIKRSEHVDLCHRIDYILEGNDYGPVLLPFNLKAAQEGAKVVTRDGIDVEIVADDLSGEYPILAIITEDGGRRMHTTYTLKGMYASNTSTPRDLFILKEPDTVYIDILRQEDGGMYTCLRKGENETYPIEHGTDIIKTITATI